jgi:hypothetical protein
MSILIERGPDYGFVYAPCRIIGTDDSHIGTEPLYIADGPSLIQLVYVYFPRTCERPAPSPCRVRVHRRRRHAPP